MFEQMAPLGNNKNLNILETISPEPISVLSYVNEVMENKRREKVAKNNHLIEWGYMKKTEKTEELKLQWKLIQHENLYTKNEYQKIKKDEKMPNFFQVATLVNGNDKIKVGAGKESQSLHTSNKRKKKCLSALQLFEKDKEMKEWCVKKYTKIQTQKNIGGKSFVRKQRKQLLSMQKA
ncbi:rRNA-processing protein FCF2 [Plasmodium brasilianum]|uniref:rRNA-processing protein, putative n=2 Tax=Plasmodium (Plasmodium) TaxID=418103 RepID=A0A1A8WJK8_PLAMA|nr:rRNA-processing protein, putative [Plasmodium malariae]KAI4835187.1 rRNA-processing protein FCF2 [Plasmodium brasilianum]SBS91448.1 rRNA-processing protein, putative [Plasmodium malariae]SCP03771.1 rRNA-processing protein, putative [Plasmodium malariae]